MTIKLPVLYGLDIGVIDTQNHSIRVLNEINFTCKNYIDCCSHLQIPVTKYDITRIEDNGYELYQIIESLSPIEIHSQTLTSDSERIYPIKRMPFTGTCTFLDGSLCEIHKFKPFACKIYPFILEVISSSEVMVKVHTDRLCKAIVSDRSGNSEQILLIILEYINDEISYRSHLSED